jgi:hypothetical protein
MAAAVYLERHRQEKFWRFLSEAQTANQTIITPTIDLSPRLPSLTNPNPFLPLRLYPLASTFTFIWFCALYRRKYLVTQDEAEAEWKEWLEIPNIPRRWFNGCWNKGWLYGIPIQLIRADDPEGSRSRDDPGRPQLSNPF